jgi:hypothetical protein
MPFSSDHRGDDADDEKVMGIGEETHAGNERDFPVFAACLRILPLGEQLTAYRRVLIRICSAPLSRQTPQPPSRRGRGRRGGFGGRPIHVPVTRRHAPKEMNAG